MVVMAVIILTVIEEVDDGNDSDDESSRILGSDRVRCFSGYHAASGCFSYADIEGF